MRVWGCGETERQKLNNLISTPLFTSPPLSSLSHLSFPHVCLLVISPLVLFSSNLSAHLPPLPSFVLKPHPLSFPCSCILSHPPTPGSSLHPAPTSSPFLCVPLLFLLFLICPCSPISTSAYIFKTLNNFKHSDRKH